MGRRIYHEDNFVWKYAFARQSSEQSRIANELNIGEITSQTSDGDVLTLNISDVPKLKKVLEDNKESYEKAFKVHDSYWEGQKSLDWKIADEADKAALEVCKDMYFFMMIEAFIEYMEKQHKENKTEEFDFEGEY